VAHFFDSSSNKILSPTIPSGICLYIAFYDFCRSHMTLKTTPAVAARLTDHRWTLEELIAETAE
jgi:hypothetical protein